MPASTRVAHHVPGRMRIRVDGARHHPRVLEEVRDSVAATEGVHRVEVRPATSSLVIHYHGKDQRQFEDALSEQGRSTRGFHLTAAEAEQERPSQASYWTAPECGEGGEMWVKIEREAEFLAAHSQLARSVVEDTKHLDLAVKRATNNTLDLKVLVPLGLAAFSIMYLGTDVATPLWLSLGVFSFNSFVSLHPPLPYPRTEHQVVRNDQDQG